MFGHLNNSLTEDFAPSEFYLSQNFPNPFREKTVIKYCVAYRTRVKLSVYDNEGEEIEKLVDEEQNPGTYKVEFDTSTCHSRASGNLPGAIYFYRLEAGDYRSEKKMELIK